MPIKPIALIDLRVILTMADLAIPIKIKQVVRLQLILHQVPITMLVAEAVVSIVQDRALALDHQEAATNKQEQDFSFKH